MFIELVNQLKYLGSVLQNTLNGGRILITYCDKLRIVLSKLAILKYKIPHNILSLADTAINYGLPTYGNASKAILE